MQQDGNGDMADLTAEILAAFIAGFVAGLENRAEVEVPTAVASVADRG